MIVDAAPLVAAVDRADKAHRLAAHIVQADDSELLLPDAVVAEVDHLLRTRVSTHAAGAFLEDVRSQAFRRVPFGPDLFDRAVAYDSRYVDLGIADASVMALAEAERAPILTFDFADFRATRPLRGGFWRLVIDEGAFRRLIG
ncbi:MAG: PIN domain-containing protein [Actinomycetota bacterium]